MINACLEKKQQIIVLLFSYFTDFSFIFISLSVYGGLFYTIIITIVHKNHKAPDISVYV